MSSVPPLLQAIGSLTTAAAVCAAGGWALYNFGLRRIAKARVQLSVNPAGVEKVGQGYYIYVTLEAVNNGNTKVRMDQANIRVVPLSTNEGDEFSKLSHSGPMDAYEVFEGHTFLEPNESFREDIAFHSRTPGPLQVDLEFWGDNDPDHAWMVSRIIHAEHDGTPIRRPPQCRGLKITRFIQVAVLVDVGLSFRARRPDWGEQLTE